MESRDTALVLHELPVDSGSSIPRSSPFGRPAHPVSFNSRGVALILVLWVIAILSVVALEFCFAMRTEVQIAQNFKEENQRYAMAQGGVERAIAELIYRNSARMQQLRKNLKPEEVPPEQREWVTDGRPYVLPFDQGTCEVRAMGEAGKVNINVVSDPTLRKIINQLGLEGEARDVVVDSILDWRTPGELHRLNGAKSDYYQSLKDPYDCKNGNLDSIEELLLVRGVTSDLFYGKKAKTEEEGATTVRFGLRDVFSIYASGEQVDINSASATVLRIVLGIPNEVAQQIVQGRAEKGYANLSELLQKVPELSAFMATMGNLIALQSTNPYYTLESRAMNKGGGAMRGVKVIVKIDPREKTGYKIVQWIDVIL